MGQARFDCIRYCSLCPQRTRKLAWLPHSEAMIALGALFDPALPTILMRTGIIKHLIGGGLPGRAENDKYFVGRGKLTFCVPSSPKQYSSGCFSVFAWTEKADPFAVQKSRGNEVEGAEKWEHADESLLEGKVP